MAAELEDQEDNIQVTLSDGKYHQFDVFLQGKLIFSLEKMNRFPQPEEIIQKIDEYRTEKAKEDSR